MKKLVFCIFIVLLLLPVIPAFAGTRLPPTDEGWVRVGILTVGVFLINIYADNGEMFIVVPPGSGVLIGDTIYLSTDLAGLEIAVGDVIVFNSDAQYVPENYNYRVYRGPVVAYWGVFSSVQSRYTPGGEIRRIAVPFKEGDYWTGLWFYRVEPLLLD